MNASEPSWELYRSFLEVLRDGSLSGAARRLRLTQPTVGRHIDALEAALGVALFTRSQRGLSPTTAALELAPHAQAMAAASAALLRAASGGNEKERGVVRLACSETMGCEVLPAILADFQIRHPQIVIELSLSNRNEDLLRRDADLAVRMARPTQSGLVARLIGKTRVGLFAHRSYVARHGLPLSRGDLAGHYVIGFDRDDYSYRAAGQEMSRDSFSYRCDSDAARLAALRAGIGVGGTQTLIAASDPDLVPVLAEEFRFDFGVWLVMHEDLRAMRRVRLLFDHLAQGLGDFLRGPISDA